MLKNRIPVLVGVAQSVHREKSTQQINPIDMMAEVGREAGRDASLDDLNRVDTLYIVNCISRDLEAPAQDLSETLRIRPSETGYTAIGATAPQWFVNRAAERILLGESQWVLICGAEAFYTHVEIQPMARIFGGYFGDDAASLRRRFMGDIRVPLTDLEIRYGLGWPVAIYALFENALRAHWEKTLTDHRHELSSFCAGMSEIASRNPFSWTRKAVSAEEIAEVASDNRMVVYPYTKLMCSNMTVNQAAAVLMTNLEAAEECGIPRDKMVFLRGYGDAEDIFHVTERPHLWASPSLVDAVEAALGQASLSLDEVEYLDFYSCFPCAPRIAREMLGIRPEDPRPLTVTGGMPYFGGPGNNYALHAISSMVEVLRREPEAYGLVQAISWFISKHSVGLYSASPCETGLTPHDPEEKAKRYPRVKVVDRASDKGVLETYAVSYSRDARPSGVIVIGRDENGDRFLAKMRPENKVVEQMTLEEPIGEMGGIEYEESTSLNWFYL
ncbi:MAG: hypothetical protein SWK76_10910 [Actinomycetota bacterium]|nr:hypothetical protein [Actinomycetota bacterium]